jgi:hypothetical protein
MADNAGRERKTTFNKMGYMHTFSNPASETFINHVHATHGNFINVGAALGYFTLQAFSRL